MILALKIFLRSLSIPCLYYGTVWSLLWTIFSRVETGLLVLLFFLPQPNIHYKLHGYPYGWMAVDLLMLAVIMGAVAQNHGYDFSFNGFIVMLVLLVSYLALWNASDNFVLPAPLSASDSQFVLWKNYARVMLLYFLVSWVVKEERLQKWLTILMVVVILMVAVKSYRSFSGGGNFSYDKRYGGPFEVSGLGANHFGAFMASYSALVMGLLLQDTDRRRRCLYLITLVFSLHPLLYTYSRGAYLGVLVTLLFFGLVREKRFLLLLLLFLCSWRTILPPSVIDRVEMTQAESGELENSAAGRLQLWDMAYELFTRHPLAGVGFNGFTLTAAREQEQVLSGGVVLTDTHNYFVKVLCEQGLVGIFLLGLVFLRALASGLKLYRRARDPFASGLGLGFAGCTVSLLVVNCFGDRFSYLECGGYFWVLWALVDRGVVLLSLTKTPLAAQGS